MKKYTLFLTWGALFIVCAILGFIREPEGLVKAVMVMLSASFFVPGGIVLWRGIRDTDFGRVKLIRNLSALSLLLTFAALVLNFVSIYFSRTLGNLVYALLVIVSAPMVCSQYWAVSMFCWACLLMCSLSWLKKAGRKG